MSKEKFRFSILAKMLARSFIVLSVSILFVEYISYKSSSDQISELTKDRTYSVVALYAERYDQIIRAVEIDQRTIEGLPSVEGYFLNRQYALLPEAEIELNKVGEFLAALYERNTAYDLIKIIDQSEQEVIRVEEGDVHIETVLPITPFEKNNRSAAPTITIDSDANSLIFTKSIVQSRRPLGSVIIHYDLDQLVAGLAQERLFETGHLAVYNKDRSVIYDPDIGIEDSLLTNHSNLARTLSEMEIPGMADFENNQGSKHLISATNMVTQPWIIAAMVPKDEMFAGVNQTRNLILSLIIVAIALEFAAMATFTQYIVGRPVNKLLQAVQSIRGGDYTHQISLNTNDEFSDLAMAFNEMSTSLSLSITQLEEEIEQRKLVEEELEAQQIHLEETVDRRTKELQSEIAERKSVTAALTNSEARFRDIAETMSDWIWEVDDNLRFYYLSDRYYEISSNKAHHIIGKTRWEAVGAATISMAPDDWRQHQDDMENHREIKDFEYRLKSFSGDFRYYSVSGKPTYDSKGQFLGYRGAARDVTERRKGSDALKEAMREIDAANSELEKRIQERTQDLQVEMERADLANRSKTEFLNNMSHELRTPLNAVIGFSDLMISETFGSLNSPQYKEYVQHINASGNYLLEIISDILDVSKIEADKLSLEEEIFDISDCLQSCITMTSERAKEAKVNIDVNVPGELPDFKGDRRRIKQIFVNLLTNSIKFTPEEGNITLVAEATPAGGLVVRVGDDGIGIPPESQSAIFEPFARVENGYAREYEGVGLGLPIVKSLVRLHDGKIDLESQLNEGTEFTITFPSSRSVRQSAVS